LHRRHRVDVRLVPVAPLHEDLGWLRALGHAHVRLLTLAGDPHIVKHFAFELDAPAAAKREHAGERAHEAERPVQAGYRG
jgi:hypothetical protein